MPLSCRRHGWWWRSTRPFRCGQPRTLRVSASSEGRHSSGSVGGSGAKASPCLRRPRVGLPEPPARAWAAPDSVQAAPLHARRRAVDRPSVASSWTEACSRAGACAHSQEAARDVAEAAGLAIASRSLPTPVPQACSISAHDHDMTIIPRRLRSRLIPRLNRRKASWDRRR